MQTTESVAAPASGLPAAFVRSAREHVAIVREALLFDDVDRVRMVARSLKRMCGAVASSRMKALAAELERFRLGDLSTAMRVVMDLDHELAAAHRRSRLA
jgi:HPt (histidine-containing phosphotransfer) domain-containing protein